MSMEPFHLAYIDNFLEVEVAQTEVEEEAAQATPIPLILSRPTAKALNRAMACCTSHIPLAQLATTYCQTSLLLAKRALLAPTIPLLEVHLSRLVLRVPPRVYFRILALLLVFLHVQAARIFRPVHPVFYVKQAHTSRKSDKLNHCVSIAKQASIILPSAQHRVMHVFRVPKEV